ncbi:solute carrier family 28 member 3-like [Mercenaria mercenaria]|uniref:solute carrier family 28 member 3-like n=1 Tax=Mercenaria mercenaria TaxID=6596 RepID=UPI00234E8AFD|nr:solute carrier family 28 member 3-like [Mercenaria mercenaria]
MDPPPPYESTPLKQKCDEAQQGISPETTQDISTDTFNSNDGVDISMDTFISKDIGEQSRQEINIDMANHYDDANDPIRVFEPVVRVFHRISPLQFLIYLRLTLEHHYQGHKTKLWRVFLGTILILYLVYLGLAFSYRFGDEGSIRLLVVTILIVLGVAYHYLKKLYGVFLYTKYMKPLIVKYSRFRRLFRTILTFLVAVAVVLFIIIDTSLRRPYSLISALGMIVFTLLMFFFSKDPRQVTWRPVLWGLLLQLIFALIVLRTDWGYSCFVWLGDRVTQYLKYTNAGSKFVFGNDFMDHFFAFSVMPVLIFFSATISILYYLGVIQLLIEKIAFIMEFSLGTGAMESLHAAINIFVGWAEAVTLVRPFLDKMSLSELHTVMTNGFATVAGSTLAIYIWYGAPANHLISASVMSAPAALAMSKLFFPESKENRHRILEPVKLQRMGTGIIDAASVGAVGAISLVAYILASVIAFFSLLDFLNATLQWFGDRVGLSPPDYPPLSFELICSYLFWPIVFLIGVAPDDCRIVARMVGIKTFINEFLAYEDLGKVRRNRLEFAKYVSAGDIYNWTTNTSGDLVLQGTNITLTGGIISEHSEMIATYALCGFSNIVALGIMIGALIAVVPDRKQDIMNVAFRALISGSMACFMTACISGLLGDK